jgi:hypothetical protein
MESGATQSMTATAGGNTFNLTQGPSDTLNLGHFGTNNINVGAYASNLTIYGGTHSDNIFWADSYANATIKSSGSGNANSFDA